ncbi:hypothetical protein V5799_015849 [Amblyomma americanum]|uniref:Uncharacterized protein n=1 Tax=Amblyomma americanum TaxID=6943 RepID=A0AAQ4F6Q3_AMBAM
MLQGRIFHCLVAHQGKLYAIGGLGDDDSALSSAECYDPAADRWRVLSGRLCCPRLAAACVLLDHGRLVLAGGAMRPVRNAENAYLVDSVVVMRLPQFTPEAGAGEQRLPKLPSARFSASMARLANGGLILVGGATYGPTGYRSLDEVILLKGPGVDQTWTKLCPTPYRVHAALVVPVGQDVYAIGGCTDRQEYRGVRLDMLVMKGGCPGHQHDDEDLCWEHWGTLPGQLVGTEAVLFSADHARPGE